MRPLQPITLAAILAANATAATFSVINTNDSGAGSLREAITAANTNAGADQIHFNIIPGAGPHTITLASPLPGIGIGDGVTIDGYTQNGASENTSTDSDDAVLKIVLTSGGVGGSALTFFAPNNVVRGLVIHSFTNGNPAAAIDIQADSTNNLVTGCFLGTDTTGNSAMRNAIGVLMQSDGNRIGGSNLSERNVISGNNYGVYLFSIANQNLVQGNFIGVGADGTTDITGAGFAGVYLAISSHNQIGGATATPGNPPGNVIAGKPAGIIMEGGSNLVVQGNIVANNAGAGIALDFDAKGVNIGGPNATEANLFTLNGGLAIDHYVPNSAPGVTANDNCDADTGPNDFQNFPVLTTVTGDGGSTMIDGFLDSVPNQSYRLDFFANTACDGSGHGEGELYLGSATHNAGGSCSNSFSVTLPVTIANGAAVTATATDPTGNTSEFSACRTASVVNTNPVAPQITCPANITTSTPTGSCSRSVSFNATASGNPTPTVTYSTNNLAVTSPVTFPRGITTVTAIASNSVGTALCALTVTVNDTVAPVITCHGNITTNVPAGVTNAVVFFEPPTIDENCAFIGATGCLMNSGDTFPLGTTPVTCFAVDGAANTNTCSFDVIVHETPTDTHDLALVKIKAPKNVNLKGAEPSLTKFVKVQIQNRSPHDEVITNFNGLVTLVAESLSNECPNATVVLHPGPPNNPKTLKPKKKMFVTFDVTWNCANDPLKGAGHEDFRYLATVHHEAIDGNPDTHPEDDGCPRAALPGGLDPNPDGKVKDTGCAEVKTDVFVKP